jgi:hypothetical protein
VTGKSVRQRQPDISEPDYSEFGFTFLQFIEQVFHLKPSHSIFSVKNLTAPHKYPQQKILSPPFAQTLP